MHGNIYFLYLHVKLSKLKQYEHFKTMQNIKL